MIGFWALTIISALIWTGVFIRIRLILAAFPPLNSTADPADPAEGWPFLSLIVPARNEEHDVEDCLRSLIRQDYPDCELIFVDDESTDRTLERARRILNNHPRGLIIEGKPRPSKTWIGKNWALVQGAAKAQGEWLVFIDADIVHHPSTLRQAVAMALRMRLDALSIMPAIECRSLWDIIVMPLFVLLNALVEPVDRVNRTDHAGSRLSGAFILIKRSAYDSIEGHQGVADRIIEDMALAQNLKGKGFRLWLTYTRDLTQTRMHDSFRDLWSGLTRLSFPMMHHRVSFLVWSWLAALLGGLMPWIALLTGLFLAVTYAPLEGAGLMAAGTLVILGMMAAMKPICAFLRLPVVFTLLLPLGALLYCLAATRSAIRHSLKYGVEWKQRIYGTDN